ncbi:uncharacterized protein LOC141628180 [Silene latifolia]|uniref:uncharacterized protein LOC141628180 n=1 Tax=Silene latifolia TaxID=37657 RepID=UPI003D77C065
MVHPSVAYQQQIWSTQNGHGYTIAKEYEWLREKGQKVQWYGHIWNKWSIPKHSFISWIYQQGNMNTNAKLYNLGIKDDNTCYICGSGIEDLDHLFFDCRYSREVITLVGEWLRMDIPAVGLLAWRLTRGGTRDDKGIINAVINACIYNIWQQRNNCRMNAYVIRLSSLARQLIVDLKSRFLYAKENGNRGNGGLVRALLERW